MTKRDHISASLSVRRVCIALAVILMAVILMLPALSLSDTAFTSWEQVRSAFQSAVESQRQAFTFTLSGGLLSLVRNQNELMWYWGARGGAADFEWTYRNDGTVSVSNLKGYSVPWHTAASLDEYVQTVAAMREKNAGSFVILAGDTLYDTLTKDRKQSMEISLSAGLFGWDHMFTHDGRKSIEYTGCEYWQGSLAQVSTETEALEAMRHFGREGVDAFALSVSDSLWRRLEVNAWDRLQTLKTLAFVEAGLTYYTEERIILFRREGSAFFPGYQILRAYESRSESALPPLLQQTLSVARRWLRDVSGTPAQMALAIHDLLCARVAYADLPNTDADDCCIGPILYGQANCDGYADAYALLCGLKGIPALLWRGEGLEAGLRDREGHMWNLIQLDGTWRSVDVTWDDQDSGTIWRYYNIGTDRMASKYTYLADLLPQPMLRSTDLLDRPTPEFEAGTQEQAIRAMREAAQLGVSSFLIRMTPQLYASYQSDSTVIWKWMELAGIAGGSVFYSDTEQWVELSELAVLGNDIIVSEVQTEEELVQKLQGIYADASIDEIRLYLSESLFARFLSDSDIVWRWLRRGGFSGANVQYSSQSMKIVYLDLQR